MNIKLTLGERLKDLRVERDLKLETLAEFYGVTTDYLLGVTENKKRPDAVLSDLHLSDGAGRTLLRQNGERTPLVPLQACAGWAETISCHAHPRILLPQNRCLPEPLAAPFPRQPEPRCNTLDFASKVVCQRGAASRLSARSGASKCAAF